MYTCLSSYEKRINIPSEFEYVCLCVFMSKLKTHVLHVLNSQSMNCDKLFHVMQNFDAHYFFHYVIYEFIYQECQSCS